MKPKSLFLKTKDVYCKDLSYRDCNIHHFHHNFLILTYFVWIAFRNEEFLASVAQASNTINQQLGETEVSIRNFDIFNYFDARANQGESILDFEISKFFK